MKAHKDFTIMEYQQFQESMLTNLPIPHDLFVGVPISCLLIVG